MNIPRKDWPGALCALHAGEVKATVAELLQKMEVRDVALPQAGLGLLSLRDGAFREPFFIGEIPVARAEVIVRTAAGDEARGGTVIVDDRAQLARSIAILDAVMAGKLPGWEQAAALGATRRRNTRTNEQRTQKTAGSDARGFLAAGTRG